jgi:hypothetical protein
MTMKATINQADQAHKPTLEEYNEIEKIRQEIHTFLEDRGYSRGPVLSTVSAALSIVQTDIFRTVAPSVEKACMLARVMAKTMQHDLRTRKDREPKPS